MKMSDDELMVVVRDVLERWADEAPVAGEAELDDMPVLTLVGSVPKETTRRPWWPIAIGAVAAAVALTVVVVEREDTTPAEPSRPSTIEIPIGSATGVKGLDVTDDAVWMSSQFDEKLFKIDPATSEVVAVYTIPPHVEGIRAVGDGVWLSRYAPNEVVRLDLATGELGDPLGFDTQPSLGLDGDRLLVIAQRNFQGVVLELDPTTGDELQSWNFAGESGFSSVDEGVLWFSNLGTTTVTALELDGGEVRTVDVGGSPRGVAITDDAVWVAVHDEDVAGAGRVVRIDPATFTVVAEVATGRWANGVAVVGDRVWVTNSEDGTISIVDPYANNSVVVTTPIGDWPGAIEAGHGSVWVAPHRRTSLVRIDAEASLEAAAVADVAEAIEVPGGTVFVRCAGTGSPTIVLEGADGSTTHWAVVEARLSRTNRVCSYDRVGMADPEQAMSDDAESIATDLAAALDAIGETDPVVLVGDGEGAGYAGTFADLFPERTIDVVLFVAPVSPEEVVRAVDQLTTA